MGISSYPDMEHVHHAAQFEPMVLIQQGDFTMKKKLIFSALALSFALIAAPSAQASPGVTSHTEVLNFTSADQTFSFNVSKAGDAGRLTVDTKDCCLNGDLWTVDIDTALPAAAKYDVSATGDGSTSEFSGPATVKPFISGCVTVSYDSGVDNFPAGMEVRFDYSEPDGMIIEPVDSCG